MKNKKILALLLACTIMASGVPVYAADFSDGTAESVQDAESSLFGMEDSELTEDTMPAFADMEENADNEIFSNELKKQAGYGKDGEKGFDGAVANLMMQMYICNCDFRKRINKRGEQYGWDVAVYSSIEHIYGYDYVTSDYKEKPEASWQKIVSHMNILYSSATEKQIKKILK